MASLGELLGRRCSRRASVYSMASCRCDVSGRRIDAQRLLELLDRLVDMAFAEPIRARQGAVRVRAIGLQANAFAQRDDGFVDAAHREQRVAALDVRVGVAGPQRDRLGRQRQAALEQVGQGEKRAFDLERAGQSDHRLDVPRIALERFLEQRDRAIDRIAPGEAEVEHPARVGLVRLDRLRAGVGDRGLVLLCDLHLQPFGQLAHQPVLQIEEVLHPAIHLDGGDLPAAGHLDRPAP